MLNNDLMYLMILTALSIIAIMIAVNAEGKGRIAISWLLSAILVAGNAIVVADYFKSNRSISDDASYNQRLVDEKNKISESLEVSSVGNQDLNENDLKSDEISRILEITSQGIPLAEKLSSLNLDDYALSEERRIAEAASLKRQSQELIARFETIKPTITFYRDNALSQALEKLDKSAMYCKLYYTSADSDQEGVREKAMRTSSIASKELFLKVNRKIESQK